jgi:hypothetical protein
MLKVMFLFLIWVLLLSVADNIRSIAHDVHILASPPAAKVH